MEKREDYSKWKKRGSKRVGVRSRKTGRLLQEEEEEGKVGKLGKSPKLKNKD